MFKLFKKKKAIIVYMVDDGKTFGNAYMEHVGPFRAKDLLEICEKIGEDFRGKKITILNIIWL